MDDSSLPQLIAPIWYQHTCIHLLSGIVYLQKICCQTYFLTQPRQMIKIPQSSDLYLLFDVHWIVYLLAFILIYICHQELSWSLIKHDFIDFDTAFLFVLDGLWLSMIWIQHSCLSNACKPFCFLQHCFVFLIMFCYWYCLCIILVFYDISYRHMSLMVSLFIALQWKYMKKRFAFNISNQQNKAFMVFN